MTDPRATWLRKRRDGIGASDAAAVLGANPWRTPFQVYLEKTGELEPLDISEDPKVRAGVLLEPVVSKWFCDDTGYVVENPGRFNVQRSPEIPWLLATLDRKIVERPKQRGEGTVKLAAAEQGVLEIKTTDARNEEKWDEEPPLWVLVQVQHQLVATGLSWGCVAVLIGGNRLKHYKVERNDPFIARMLAVEEEFWKRVTTRRPPPVDGSEVTQECLKRLYASVEPGLHIDLPQAFVDLDARLLEARARKAQAESDERALMNVLRQGIAHAETASLPNGVLWTAKVVERSAYKVGANKYRDYRRKAPKE